MRSPRNSVKLPTPKSHVVSECQDRIVRSGSAEESMYKTALLGHLKNVRGTISSGRKSDALSLVIQLITSYWFQFVRPYHPPADALSRALRNRVGTIPTHTSKLTAVLLTPVEASSAT